MVAFSIIFDRQLPVAFFDHIDLMGYLSVPKIVGRETLKHHLLEINDIFRRIV
ncbi:hypothetical protein SAMN05216228_107212 [Rhizobium tibeticum]|uniref:Uncharacterized protein n=1 Tax=Rhizobium tibeticum TaxID=501024 RepID=A0A1H8WQL2_9HYPH|nr:hypothetical protein RTCCBAU85039_6718 [Rhizobium tibeticum]SEP29378.1 hypothetical protein SAMN05216228_107212 [Rhizobium tibeticum]